ncbi:MAG: peptidoglycan DD-metalloendopeptidase family protein [Hyphomicrobiales bacterium]
MIKLASECSRHGGRIRLALLTATALTLAACSGSVDRFTDFSDVNTSSLPDEQATDSEVASSQIDDPSGRQQSERPAWQNAPTDRAGDERRDREPSGTVTVQSGQTIYSIARANDLSPDELARANDIAPPYAIRVGQRLKVPGRADPVAPVARDEPQTIEAANASSSRPQFGDGDTHVVRPGETLFAVGRAYRMNPYKIAEHNKLREPYELNVGQKLRIPSGDSHASRRDEEPETRDRTMTLDGQMAERRDAADRQESPDRNRDDRPERQAMAPETIEVPEESRDDGGPNDEAVASTFRWPVKGRIISTYGEKPTGMRNEGINIAVPEGTSVRAAGPGIVAYAGNELKGYGNLVLIRHDGGWVTAYAHNKELLVNRGDSVERGDVIANAGQTGSVSSPQVHFEVRKGATAVDPMKHLDTDQAMN